MFNREVLSVNLRFVAFLMQRCNWHVIDWFVNLWLFDTCLWWEAVLLSSRDMHEVEFCRAQNACVARF